MDLNVPYVCFASIRLYQVIRSMRAHSSLVQREDLDRALHIHDVVISVLQLSTLALDLRPTQHHGGDNATVAERWADVGELVKEFLSLRAWGSPVDNSQESHSVERSGAVLMCASFLWNLDARGWTQPSTRSQPLSPESPTLLPQLVLSVEGAVADAVMNLGRAWRCGHIGNISASTLLMLIVRSVGIWDGYVDEDSISALVSAFNIWLQYL